MKTYPKGSFRAADIIKSACANSKDICPGAWRVFPIKRKSSWIDKIKMVLDVLIGKANVFYW